MIDCDIAVVGAGAAGHAAAIAAARLSAGRHSVLLLERADRVGRKLLATGGGTCNLTNLHVSVERYHGADPGFVSPVLHTWSAGAVMDFFDEIGVPCRTEPDGRAYPCGAQASAVQDALRLEAQRRGVVTLCGFDVGDVRVRDPILLEDTPLYVKRPFELVAGDGRVVRTSRLIVATGGPAAPQLGGSDTGHRLLGSLGHVSTQLLPAIVQITTERPFVKSLSGIRVQGVATLLRNGNPVRSEQGEILFTDYGLSGPASLQLGGMVSRAIDTGGEALEIAINFYPEMDRAALTSWLIHRAERLTGVSGMDFLSGALNKRVGQAVFKAGLGQKLTDPVGVLDPATATRLANAIQDTRIRVTGVQGWREAQVTAGGVEVSGFEPETLESRIIPGLYTCGEVLDVDGDCGGYNLHWAWASGLVAGNRAARSLEA